MANQVLKVKSSAVAAMTCPLCHKLLDEATTISLCLHTFCRKCIYDILSDEDVNSCPVCNTNLGCSPIDKLRPDHALRSLRDKIFPKRNKKTKISGAMPPSTPPTKRKQRSLINQEWQESLEHSQENVASPSSSCTKIVVESTLVLTPVSQDKREASIMMDPMDDHSSTAPPAETILGESSPGNKDSNPLAQGGSPAIVRPQVIQPATLRLSKTPSFSNLRRLLKEDPLYQVDNSDEVKSLVRQLLDLLGSDLQSERQFDELSRLLQEISSLPVSPEIFSACYVFQTNFWGSWADYEGAIQKRDELKALADQIEREGIPSPKATTSYFHLKEEVKNLLATEGEIRAKISALQEEERLINKKIKEVSVDFFSSRDKVLRYLEEKEEQKRSMGFAHAAAALAIDQKRGLQRITLNELAQAWEKL